jgi:DNA polymerase-4
VVSGDGAKSISVEATYEQDLLAPDDIEKAVLRHCDRLSGRLRRSGMAGHTVSLKLRFGDFTTVTRSVTSAVPIEHTPDLWDAARGLLRRIDIADRGIRLLGIGAMGLVPSSDPRQLSLEHAERSAAAEAAEAVRARFGDDAVVPARLVERPEDDPDGGRAPQVTPPG